MGEHAHLSYAAAAYGVQGATVDSSRTVLSEATSAASVYVGMTRGRETNRLHVVASNLADARAQFIEAMERYPADRGLDHATRAAHEAVRGLIADGPVALVTEELARLDHKAERAEVAGPLTAQAEQGGAAYLTAVEDEAAARVRLATVGRFGRRKARTAHRSATGHTQELRGQVSTDRLPEWAIRVAKSPAEAEPRLTDAAQTIETATADSVAMQHRHEQERMALLVSEHGAERVRRDHLGMRITNPHRHARDAYANAAATRAEAYEHGAAWPDELAGSVVAIVAE